MVSVSSTTSEIDVATRITISPALCRPWLVSPTRCPNHDPSGTTMWPWVTKLKVAGRTTTPVKIGMNSHTRLTKNPTGRREAAASPRVAAYMATSTGMLRTRAAVISSPSRLASLTRGSIRCRRPGRAAVSSENIACRRTPAPPFRVFSTKLPLRRLPMHPQGQSPTSASRSHLGVADDGLAPLRARTSTTVAAGSDSRRRSARPTSLNTTATTRAMTSIPTTAETR